jgi:hypothetical protein
MVWLEGPSFPSSIETPWEKSSRSYRNPGKVWWRDPNTIPRIKYPLPCTSFSGSPMFKEKERARAKAMLVPKRN